VAGIIHGRSGFDNFGSSGIALDLKKTERIPGRHRTVTAMKRAMLVGHLRKKTIRAIGYQRAILAANARGMRAKKATCGRHFNQRRRNHPGQKKKSKMPVIRAISNGFEGKTKRQNKRQIAVATNNPVSAIL